MSEAVYLAEERAGLRGYVTPEEPLVVTRYTAAQLARAPQLGTELVLTWCAWRELTREPRVLAHKADAGAVVFASLSGGRKVAAVQRVTALVLDHDAGTTEAWDARLPWQAIVHTTHSHTPAHPRWRAYVRLSRAMTAAEHRVVWAWAHARVGLVLDGATRDPSRIWYVPARREGAAWWWGETEGAPLDVDRALAMAAEHEAACRAAAQELPPVEHTDAYARAAIAGERARVASASVGARHAALWAAAYSLSRLVEESVAVAELLPAFVAVAGGQREREGRACIRDAYRARVTGGQHGSTRTC